MNTKPNIIFVMSDQQRWDTLGCNGNDFVQTPNVDAMAAVGTNFSHAYTVQPICTPARGTMWTGVYPHVHRIQGNVYGVDDVISKCYDKQCTLFHTLRNEGYKTAYFGKWHLGEAEPGLFDEWDAFNSLGGHWVDGYQASQGGTYIPDVDTQRGVDFIKRQANSDIPFCLTVAYYPPHDPFTAPDQHTDKYRGKGVPFAGYYGAVSAVDECLGHIRQALKDTGLSENTLLIYFSDHGETFCARHAFSHKEVCTDDAIRIPMVMELPGQVQQSVTLYHFVGLQDLMPTVLDYVGCEVPSYLHGRSLRPLLEGKACNWRDSFYIQNTTRRGMELVSINPWMTPVVGAHLERAVRTHDWKLVLSDGGPCQLYDLRKDPEEVLNIYGAPREDNFDQFCHFDANESLIRELTRKLLAEAQAIEDHEGARLAEKSLQSPIEAFDWNSYMSTN